MKVVDALEGVGRLGVETAPYVYYVENHPGYADKVAVIFEMVEAVQIEVVTSTIALTEILIKPIQLGDHNLTQIYRELLTQTPRLSMHAVTAEVADEAAFLRAKYRLRTPDALHLATAITGKCEAFLTNDFALSRVSELRVLILDDLEI